MSKPKLPVLADFPPPPTPADVLYVAPTGTGEGRLCRNCVLWDSGGGRCVIHRKSVRVNATMVCGYHIYGQPLASWVAFPGIQPVEAATSGLIQVAEPGTACGNCAAFESAGGRSTAGMCLAVGEVVRGSWAAKPGSWRPAQVDAFGCCTRWTAIETR